MWQPAEPNDHDEQGAVTSSLPTFGGYHIWSDIWVRSGWRVQQSTLTDAVRLLDPARRVAAAGTLAECLDAGRRHAPSAGHDRAVVLLHGIGWGRTIMRKLERALGQAGWAVANVGYPSLRRPLEHHAAAVAGVARGLQEDGANSVALVGHSLGGLIARAAASDAAGQGWRSGRMVLLGSPAQGSAIAETLQDWALYRAVAGDCGQTVTPAGAAKVPVPDTEIAVIAGGTGKQGFNPLLPGDNDGVVTVAETRLPGGEADFLLVPSVHTLLPTNAAAIAATLRFLQTGRLAIPTA